MEAKRTFKITAINGPNTEKALREILKFHQKHGSMMSIIERLISKDERENQK